jgi:hypothetical protein
VPLLQHPHIHEQLGRLIDGRLRQEGVWAVEAGDGVVVPQQVQVVGTCGEQREDTVSWYNRCWMRQDFWDEISGWRENRQKLKWPVAI